MLSVLLFGAPRVLVDANPVTIARRKNRAILYYVAAQTEAVNRRQLLALLWPDHEPETARHNLRSTVYSLRQALGAHLVVEQETLALAQESSVDTRTFEAALSAAALRTDELAAALALYQGAFLDGFDTPDAPDYEDWIAVTREHYQRLAIRGYSTLSQFFAAEHHYQDALAALQRALTYDPLQEDLQRAAMRLHYQAGDRAGAVRRFEELRRLLDEEMGLPPMAETRALYDAIVTDAALPDESRLLLPMPTAMTTKVMATKVQPVEVTPPVRNLRIGEGVEIPFIGRNGELQRLEELEPSHQLIVVEGEPGIGKTRLATNFLSSRRTVQGSHAPLALVGQAHELESRLPYQPIIDALRSVLAAPEWPALRLQLDLAPVWRTEIARLTPELLGAERASAAYTPDESRLWEGIAQLLLALALSRPLYFFLDDLHWADAATLGLLGYLVRQTGQAGAPIVFLATSRPALPRSELAALFQSLLRENQLARLSLERLSNDEVLALARQISPHYGYPLGAWLWRGSEGNPLILAELLRHARAEAILTPDGVVNLSRLPDSPVVPQTVYTLFQARLEHLSEPARRILDAAVVIGREFGFEIVARAAALSDDAALDALDELRRARLIQSLNDFRFTFDHPLILEVARREVGDLRRRLLHRRVAAALETIHHDRLDEFAGLIAQHYGEGGQPELASRYAWRAGQRAAGLAAWAEAISFYEQALQGPTRELRSTILAALGAAHLQAGRYDQAAETLREAQQLAEQQNDLPTLATVLNTLSESLLMQARYEEAITMAKRLAARTEPELLFAVEFLWGAALSLEGVDLDEATKHLHKAEEYTRQSPGIAPPERLGQIAFELGNVAAQQGQLEEAVRHYRRSLDATRHADTDLGVAGHILAYNNLAYHLHLLNDPAALDYAQQGVALAREKGATRLMPYLFSTLGEIALAQGDLAVAEFYFGQGLAMAQRNRHPERIAGLTASLGLVAQRRGEIELAVHRLSTALVQAETLHSRYLATRIRLWLAPLLPPDAATAYLDEARAVIEDGHYETLRAELDVLTP
jgi:DNA-binding SARP family transcriptional activator